LETELKELAARENELKDKSAASDLRLTSIEESLVLAQAQLKEETARRASAEAKADEFAGIRAALEGEVAQRRQAEEKLQRESVQREEQLQSRLETLNATHQKLETELSKQRAAHLAEMRQASQKLAAVRYSILDASRVKNQLSRRHDLALRQNLDHLKQFASDLLNTPLSGSQSQLANALRTAVNDAVRDYAEASRLDQTRLEPLAVQSLAFDPKELITGAFQVIQASAAEASVPAQTTLSGSIPEKVQGDPARLYQLLTLMANSLMTMKETESLDLRVSIDSQMPHGVEAVLEFRVRSELCASDLSARLTSIVSAAGALQILDLDHAASGFALGWELAQALGAATGIKVSGDKETALRIVLPLARPA
jgi:hypothetical protein